MIFLEKVLKPKTIFDKSFFLKDCSKNYILNHYPELETLINSLASQMPNKKYLTIDYQGLNLKSGQKTCKDTSWHIDGEGNNYILVCWGDFKTQFAGNFQFSNTNRKTRLTELKKMNIDRFQEALEGVPVAYSSDCVHRGCRADQAGQRLFLRLCMSDYLHPKNKKLF